MKKVKCVIISAVGALVIFAFQPGIHAQAVWNPSVTGHAVKGIINVSASIVADSFVPMTHYRAGQWTVTGVPAWFQVDRPFRDPTVKGDDLYGWAGALGGGYALNDRLMVYGIFAMLSMDGGVKGKLYDDLAGDVTADTDFSLLSFNTGIGFDLVPGKGKLSVPVFAGIFVQRYDATVKMPQIGYTFPVPGDLRIHAEGDGLLGGVTMGIAVSYNVLGFLRITPYYLYSRSFNKPEMTVTLEDSNLLPIKPEETIEIDPVNASMVGLCLTMISTTKLSVSLSIGGILSSSSGFYNDVFLDGLRMKSVVLAVTYRSVAGP